MPDAVIAGSSSFYSSGSQVGKSVSPITYNYLSSSSGSADQHSPMELLIWVVYDHVISIGIVSSPFCTHAFEIDALGIIEKRRNLAGKTGKSGYA